MPTYQYHCETNGQVLEVRHNMSEKLHTWGELCERSGHDLGETPAETPIRRAILGGQLMLKSEGMTRSKLMQQAKEAKGPAQETHACHPGCAH